MLFFGWVLKNLSNTLKTRIFAVRLKFKKAGKVIKVAQKVMFDIN